MTNQSAIQHKLEELDQYLQQLQRLQRYTYNDLISDLEKCWAVEHGLQLVAQIVIDVGNALLADRPSIFKSRFAYCVLHPSKSIGRLRRFYPLRSGLLEIGERD